MPSTVVNDTNIARVRFYSSADCLPQRKKHDDRVFLFVDDDQVFCGYHIIDAVFEDTNGYIHHDVDAWVEWVEICKVDAPPQH